MSERTSISFSSSCSGLAKCGVPTKPPMRQRHRVLALPGTRRFREAEVDHLHHQFVVLAHQHEIRRLDVAMHEPVLLRGIQRARDLIA